MYRRAGVERALRCSCLSVDDTRDGMGWGKGGGGGGRRRREREGDLWQRVAQDLHVVKAEGGDAASGGVVDDVGGIDAPADADLHTAGLSACQRTRRDMVRDAARHIITVLQQDGSRMARRWLGRNLQHRDVHLLLHEDAQRQQRHELEEKRHAELVGGLFLRASA